MSVATQPVPHYKIMKLIREDDVFRRIVTAMIETDMLIHEMCASTEKIRKYVEIGGDDVAEHVANNILYETRRLGSCIKYLHSVSEKLAAVMTRYLERATGKKVLHRYGVDDYTRDTIAWMYDEDSRWCVTFSYIDGAGEEHVLDSICAE